jgi:anaerobic selenocysteine-containing dehydrogenase
VFRDLGVRLGLSEAGDDLGEVGSLMDVAAKLPAAAAAAILDGAPAPIPGDGRPIQFVDVMPRTADGKAHLFPAGLDATHGLYQFVADPATPTYPLALISPASAHTVSSTLGELRPGIARMKINPEDAHPRHIGDGDSVRIFNALGEVHVEATISPEIRPGTISLPKGLWNRSTFNGATANALVPDTLTDIAGGACFNDARVQVELLARH